MTKHDVFMEMYELLAQHKLSLETKRSLLRQALDGCDGPIEAHEKSVSDELEKVTALMHIHGLLFKDGWYKNNDELSHLEV